MGFPFDIGSAIFINGIVMVLASNYLPYEKLAVTGFANIFIGLVLMLSEPHNKVTL